MTNSIPMMGCALFGLLATAALAGEPAAHYELAGNKLDIPIESIRASTSTDVMRDSSATTHVVAVRQSCDRLNSIREVEKVAKEEFKKQKLRSAYDSVVAAQVTILTVPKIEKASARLYYYTARTQSCPGPDCAITIQANLIVAPVRESDGVILMSKAVYKDDETSGYLLDSANNLLDDCH